MELGGEQLHEVADDRHEQGANKGARDVHPAWFEHGGTQIAGGKGREDVVLPRADDGAAKANGLGGGSKAEKCPCEDKGNALDPVADDARLRGRLTVFANDAQGKAKAGLLYGE